MSPSRLVTTELFRIYRTGALFLGLAMILVVGIGSVIVHQVTEPTFSLWLLIGGAAAKYWLLVVGTLLVTLNLRPFVANGVTRRDFLAGATVFGLLTAVVFAALVPLGHGVEQVLTGLAGPLPADYPVTSFGTALREFGQVLPASLAALVSGIAAAGGFYRFGAWGGLALLIPALLPLGISEGLLGIDEHGGFDTRFVPYLTALLISLLVTALGGLLYQRELHDVAIRRTAAG